MTRVAIQGIAGSYSEEATRLIFGSEVSIVECDDFDSTFSALRTHAADHAVVPVENKIVGEIRPPLELLKDGDYRMLGSLSLKVQHALVGTPDATLDELRTVRSHIEALKQCRRFLTANSQLKQIVGADTASSLRDVVEAGDPSNAAIASRRAAELYRAKILRASIADDLDNWTTFYVIGN